MSRKYSSDKKSSMYINKKESKSNVTTKILQQKYLNFSGYPSRVAFFVIENPGIVPGFKGGYTFD